MGKASPVWLRLEEYFAWLGVQHRGVALQELLAENDLLSRDTCKKYRGVRRGAARGQANNRTKPPLPNVSKMRSLVDATLFSQHFLRNQSLSLPSGSWSGAVRRGLRESWARYLAMRLESFPRIAMHLDNPDLTTRIPEGVLYDQDETRMPMGGEQWLISRQRYYLMQSNVERRAQAVMLGTPIISQTLSPPIIRERLIGDSTSSHEVVSVIYKDRCNRILERLAEGSLRVRAMFQEKPTAQFLASLDALQRDAFLSHLDRIGRVELRIVQGLLPPEEQALLSMSLTEGGTEAGVASADQLVESKSTRRARVVQAMHATYRNRREFLFDRWEAASPLTIGDLYSWAKDTAR